MDNQMNFNHGQEISNIEISNIETSNIEISNLEENWNFEYWNFKFGRKLFTLVLLGPETKGSPSALMYNWSSLMDGVVPSIPDHQLSGSVPEHIHQGQDCSAI
jgi:hypothetical protein